MSAPAKMPRPLRGMAIGESWPPRFPILRLEGMEDGRAVLLYVGTVPKALHLSAAEKSAIRRAGAMPGVLRTAIEDAGDEVPAALREALRIANDTGKTARKAQELRPYGISGGRRLVQRLNGLLEEVELVRLTSGIYCDRERIGIFGKAGNDEVETAGADDQNGDEAGNARQRRPLREMDPGGMPVLHAIYRPNGEAEGNSDEETQYKISWSSRSDTECQTVSAKELNSGACWERWGGLAISSKSEISRFANIVKAQASAFNIPVTRLARRAGFNIDKASGLYSYILPDGRELGGDGTGLIHKYKFNRSREWEGWTPPDKAPSGDCLAALVRWITETDPRGRRLILLCLSARSALWSISSMAVAAILLGQAGTGKTMSANFARGTIGPCSYEHDAGTPDATFGASATNVENAIRPLGDMPILIDDGHPNDEQSSADRSMIYKVIDRLTTSAHNGTEMYGRADRGGGNRVGVKVAGLPIVTLNSMRGAKPEHMRRWILLEYNHGEVDHDATIEGWEHFQAIETAAGHAVIRSAVDRLNTNPNGAEELRKYLTHLARQYAGRISEALKRERPDAPSGEVNSVAGNYAQILVGARLVEEACGAPGSLIDHVQPFILPFAIRQLDMSAHGGVSSIDLDWITAAIREEFATRAHLFGVYGGPLSGPEAIDWGYMSSSAGGQSYQPRGQRVGWISADYETVYFRPDALGDVLHRRARNDRLAWPEWSNKTFTDAMVRIGLAVPESGSERSCQRVYVASKRLRVLAIPAALIHPDLYGSGSDDPSPSGPPIPPRGNGQPPAPPAPRPAESGERSAARSSAELARDRLGAELLALGAGANWPMLPAPDSDDATLVGDGEATWRDLAERGSAEDIRAAIDAIGNATAPHPGKAIDKAPPFPEVDPPGDDGPPLPPAPDKPAHESESAEAHPRATWGRMFGVIDADALHIADPETGEESVIRGSAPGSLADLLRIAERESLGQLWVHKSFGDAAGMPEGHLRNPDGDKGWRPHHGVPHEFAEAPLPEEWRLFTPKGYPGRVRAWTVFKHHDGREVSIAIPHLGLSGGGGFDGASSGAALLEALVLFKKETEITFRNGAVFTFKQMMRSLHRGRKALDLSPSTAPAHFPEPARDGKLVHPPDWLRPLTDSERQTAKYIHAYDKNAQYLGAMKSLGVGFGVAELIAKPTFNKKVPGYWRAKIIASTEHRGSELQHPCIIRPNQPDPTKDYEWYPTPTLELAAEWGIAFDISEAWLYPETHKPFEPVYKRLRDARLTLLEMAKNSEGAAIALSALKQVYRAGVGGLALRSAADSEKLDSLYRSDWRHVIIAKAQANLLRSTEKAKLRPIVMETDAIYIASDNPDPIAAACALPLGDGVGQFKPKWKHPVPIDVIPAAFVNGGTLKHEHLNALKKLGKELTNA